MSAAPVGLIYPAEPLVPEEWKHAASGGPLRCFNPALLAHGERWLFAYRLVASDGVRRIGLCQLDRSLTVIPGSATPLSDGFTLSHAAEMPEVARSWFADPRLYRLNGRLFVYWNTGWHEPRNYQFLHELDATTLKPIGAARELVLATGERQKLEKNWTLFTAANGEVHAIYSITPHRVLDVHLAGTGDIRCYDKATVTWPLRTFPPCHGGLRGGTPPHPLDEGFASVCHSVHDGPDGYRYCASVYRFGSGSDFAPTHEPASTIELFNPYGARRIHPRLNPAVADVVYPCGLVRDQESWLVSHGINDEHCAITRLEDAQLRAAALPLVADSER